MRRSFNVKPIKASSEAMSDQKIKELLSSKLQLQDKALEACIRRILFNRSNSIDWQQAYEIMKYEMPELEINSSTVVAGKLGANSWRYQGYRISLEHKGGVTAYNIYDSHGEMESSGYTSLKQAKEEIDNMLGISGSYTDILTKELLTKFGDKVVEQVADAIPERGFTLFGCDVIGDNGEVECIIDDDLGHAVQTGVTFDLNNFQGEYDLDRYVLEAAELAIQDFQDMYKKVNSATDVNAVSTFRNSIVPNLDDAVRVIESEMNDGTEFIVSRVTPDPDMEDGYEVILVDPVQDYSFRVDLIPMGGSVNEIADRIRSCMSRKFKRNPSKTDSQSGNVSATSYSYGGAFDVEDDMFFTKEEIVEFGDAVAEKITSVCGPEINTEFRLTDVWMNDSTVMHLEITDSDEYTVDYEFNIDFRKIRKPSDLIEKYRDKIALDVYLKFISIWPKEDEYVDSSTIVSAAIELDIRDDSPFQIKSLTEKFGEDYTDAFLITAYEYDAPENMDEIASCPVVSDVDVELTYAELNDFVNSFARNNPTARMIYVEEVGDGWGNAYLNPYFES